ALYNWDSFYVTAMFFYAFKTSSMILGRTPTSIGSEGQNGARYKVCGVIIRQSKE
ncbi:10469_t:CDS:1, partial [Acaulospora colombiana]